MSDLLKAACLLLYLLTAATLVLPASEVATALQLTVLVVLGAHLLELLLAFRIVKRHPGPLLDSIGLTLLFGALHWTPLIRAK